MRMIDRDCDISLEIAEAATLTATVTGSITVCAGGELTLKGQVIGTVTVRPGGALVLLGRVKGEVVNEGGAVDVFGYVGRVSDVGTTETYVSRGAIIGGRRASRPSRLSRMMQ